MKYIAYWVNTSSNTLIRDLVLDIRSSIHETIYDLMEGGLVQTRVDGLTSFRDFVKNRTSLWSLLLFSGYLTVRETVEIGRERISRCTTNTNLVFPMARSEVSSETSL